MNEFRENIIELVDELHDKELEVEAQRNAVIVYDYESKNGERTDLLKFYEDDEQRAGFKVEFVGYRRWDDGVADLLHELLEVVE